jgi:microcystin-dependent protein
MRWLAASAPDWLRWSSASLFQVAKDVASVFGVLVPTIVLVGNAPSLRLTVVQPFLCVNFIIALTGIYPARD